MALINVGELIDDPDFAQAFTITRRSGNWENGRFIPVETTIQASGIISPKDTSELDLAPDGSMIRGRIKVWTHTQLYITIQDTPAGESYISDEVNWQGNQYLVILDNNYSDYGYYSYICQLKDASGGTNS